MNVELSDENWLQSSLPVNDGDLGICSAATLAPSAFLATAESTSELQVNMLPTESADTADDLVNTGHEAWKILTSSAKENGMATG